MAEFNFKSKKNEIRLAVRKDETEVKDLVFDCSPSNYKFIKRAMEAGRAIDAVLKGGLNFENIEQISDSERKAFETMAPGQWEEFFDYLDNDLGDMAMLIKTMLETIRSKGIEAKAESVAPVVPDGEIV